MYLVDNNVVNIPKEVPDSNKNRIRPDRGVEARNKAFFVAARAFAFTAATHFTHNHRPVGV